MVRHINDHNIRLAAETKAEDVSRLVMQEIGDGGSWHKLWDDDGGQLVGILHIVDPLNVLNQRLKDVAEIILISTNSTSPVSSGSGSSAAKSVP